MSILPFETTADSTTVDRLLSTLASEPCRLVLAYFETAAEDTASVNDLVEYVATRQAETDDPDRIRAHLYHVDLPKLADVGLVDYDVRTRTVRYWGDPAGVTAENWSQYLTQGEAA